ncbi:MAG TPA: YfhO family protein [Terriglobia bacterium]|nr:YfhO family protein [Terriglobia bacterium]
MRQKKQRTVRKSSSVVESAEPQIAIVDRKAPRGFAHSAVGGLAMALLGIVLGQAILYGPSLVGSRILLPLRMLASPGVYLPQTDETKDLTAHNVTLGDLVFFIEPERQFVASELQAGRLPLWTPYRFAGAPLYALGLSPPWLIAYLISSPVILAWTQMLVALIAGLGMYVFCRRTLGLGPWPSIIAAWAYPLTGAYILWVGQWLPAVMCWLPWSLIAVDQTVRRPWSWGGPVVCVVTTFLLVGGALDVAGQVLLVSGIYAVWRLVEEYGSGVFSRRGIQAPAALALAWALGFVCSAWILLPLGEYLENGFRVIRRSEGAEERPPVGLAAVPQVVLPDMYGSSRRGSFRIGAMALPESSAAAYTGSVACLVLAPLAFFRRRRSHVFQMVFLVFLSLSWAFDVPGLVQLLRLPMLNLMSHNRMAFVGAFAFTALAAMGFDLLLQKRIPRRGWFWVPISVLLALSLWCGYRSVVLPEPIASQLGAAIQNAPIRDIDEPWEVAEIQKSFRIAYVTNAAFCLLGIVAWGVLMGRMGQRRWVVPALTSLLMLELLYFGYGHAAQTRSALYFPRVPIFERLASEAEGRIIGFNCLPANLAQAAGLSDIRGYDGVDPSRLVRLLQLARNPLSAQTAYAATQLMAPTVFNDATTGMPRVSSILDMLSVRYIIFRGVPPPNIHPLYTDDDYWVLANERALPRAFVPKKAQVIADEEARLQAMNSGSFEPGEIAYLETPIDLPNESVGSVRFVDETPQSVTLDAKMETAGLVVLADRWDRGWTATVNDQPVPILRVNHALRGVSVGSGPSTIRFVYAPASFYRGVAVSSAGVAALLLWSAVVSVLAWQRRRLPKLPGVTAPAHA